MAEQIDTSAARPADLIHWASSIVASYVSHNSLPPGEMPALIASVHDAMRALGTGGEVPAAEARQEPAVPVKKSVTRDYLICLDDGRKFASLRRHLAVLGMTPEQYRAKWDLPADYPMVASAYSEKRSALAKSIGLGQPRTAAKGGAAGADGAPKRQARTRKAA